MVSFTAASCEFYQGMERECKGQKWMGERRSRVGPTVTSVAGSYSSCQVVQPNMEVLKSVPPKNSQCRLEEAYWWYPSSVIPSTVADVVVVVLLPLLLQGPGYPYIHMLLEECIQLLADLEKSWQCLNPSLLISSKCSEDYMKGAMGSYLKYF